MKIIEKDQNPEYIERLKKLLSSTSEWGVTITGRELESAQQNFMDELGSLYLDYFQHHEEEGRCISFDFSDLLLSVYEYINNEYIDRNFFKLLNVDPEESSWAFVCRVKTRIEAFNTLFSPVTGNLNDHLIENYLEEYKVGADATGDDIPDNVPQKHWWWYA